MIGAALLFAVMGLFAKLASRTLPNAVVVFMRTFLGLLVLVPWALRRGRAALHTQHLLGHVLRGVFGMLAMYCFFYPISRLSLAEALLLNYSLPLFLPIVERAWLGARMKLSTFRPLGMGLLGLIFILKPSTGIFQPAALVGVCSAVFAATAQVGVRSLTRTESVTSIVFYFGLVSTGIAFVPALLSWRVPDAGLWPVLIGMGTAATFAQLLMTRAYQHAPAAEVGPFIYSSVLFAAVFDWLVFTRLPDAYAGVGAALVIVAGVVALRASTGSKLPSE
jgi:drug/metabolite transporter (DMT)-like permease